MNTAIPIRNQSELVEFKEYYRLVESNMRNLTLINMGLNTALRVSDMLKLKWKDVYDVRKQTFLKHITLIEQKTGKISQIFVNESLLGLLTEYRKCLFGEHEPEGEEYLFKGRDENHLSRVQAYRVVKKAAEACDICGIISPHSLRKTFGYCACKAGVEPVMLMSIFNHSSFTVTKRYLGIEQDDRDEVFKKIQI